ncbi:MAG: hypothetical protein V7785_19130 [Bermanella sp.]
MKVIFKIASLLCLGFISSYTYCNEEITIYQNTNTGTESIIRKPALNYYLTTYTEAKEHKAFAQSSSGAWAGRVYNTSIETAKLNALVACQGNNEKHEKNYPCEIIVEEGSLLYE